MCHIKVYFNKYYLKRYYKMEEKIKPQSIKIAIISREETLQKCIGKGCFRAFNNYEDSFERYKGKNIEIVGFCHEGGRGADLLENLNERVDSFKKHGVQVVHLSSCLRSKSPHYESIKKILSKDFDIVGYTHGSESSGK